MNHMVVELKKGSIQMFSVINYSDGEHDKCRLLNASLEMGAKHSKREKQTYIV